MFGPRCERCGRKRGHRETFAGSYRADGTRIATCFACHFGPSTTRRSADHVNNAAARDRLAATVDVIHCSLLGWRRVAPGEFCSWRPIRNGLARVELDDLELIDRACELLCVERRRCGAGERWRLAP